MTDMSGMSDPLRFIGFTGTYENVCFCERCRDEADAREPAQASTDDNGLGGLERYMRRGMLLCHICGNKRCPRAEWCGYICSNSNEPGQTGVPIEE